MSREFLLPELAESVVEGEIVQWFVAEGQPVEVNQPLVDVMTDKATMELPSPYSGVLQKHLAAVGEVVTVGQAIARFDEEEILKGELEVVKGEVEGPPEPPSPKTEAEDTGQGALFKADTSEAAVTVTVSKPGEVPVAAVRGPYGRVLAVPAARKRARNLGLDITQITGSGPNGRIRVADVEAHVKQAASSPVGLPFTPIQYQTPPAYADLEERVPIRGLKRAMRDQMTVSHWQSVRTLVVDEADVTELKALRKRLKPHAALEGVKLSYLPFIIKAVVRALKAFPVVNSSLDEQTQEVVLKRYYNIGVAVGGDHGLVVPVLAQADQQSLMGVARALETLTTKARTGTLVPQDVQNGTFTLTSIGNIGGLFSFPIINVPEAAILGVHTMKKRPVVIEEDGEDKIVAREMLYLSHSFDHRLIDGVQATLFLRHVIDTLEAPEKLMLD